MRVCVKQCLPVLSRAQEVCAAETNADYVKAQGKLKRYTDTLKWVHYTLLLGDEAHKVTGACLRLAHLGSGSYCSVCMRERTRVHAGLVVWEGRGGGCTETVPDPLCSPAHCCMHVRL